MQGLHLTADLRGCATMALLSDATALRALALRTVADAGLAVVGDAFHAFAGADGQAGVTGVVLLAESHLALHTWPERAEVTLDVYVCHRGRDNSARAEQVLAALEAALLPRAVERHRIERGRAGGPPLA